MHNISKLQRLLKLPLNNGNVATARFRDHSEKSELEQFFFVEDKILHYEASEMTHYLSDDVKPGNFIEVLKYGITGAGRSLEEYFKSTPRNVTYKSKTTQNAIIDICGELITNKLTDETREAKFFSVLADEDADCANVEHLSLVVRFVDREHQIGEEFLSFAPYKNGLSGEAIANTIQDFLRGLPIDDCRGQGYDGWLIYVTDTFGLFKFTVALYSLRSLC